MNILAKLKSLVTAADMQAAAPDLAGALAEAQARQAALAAETEATIFDGDPKALTALRARKLAVAEEIETLTVAVDGLRRRAEAAAAREAMAAIEARMVRAAKLGAQRLDAYKRFASQAEALAATAQEITELAAAIETENAQARAAGRADLVISSPIADLAETTGRIATDPVPGLRIPGFYPRHPDGAPLLRMVG